MGECRYRGFQRRGLVVDDRRCESCGVSINHKRADARFCGRACKMAAWHAANRATPDGKAAEVKRNRERYAREGERRRAGARDYYWRNHSDSLSRASAYRSANPDRRRAASDARRDRYLSNPGYVKINMSEWRAMLNRHRHRCAYCGSGGKLEMDHVIPISRGGRHALANILPACRACNSSKSAKYLSEWRLSYGRR